MKTLPALVLTFATSLLAQDALPKKSEVFEAEGRKAVFYTEPKPADGKPRGTAMSSCPTTTTRSSSKNATKPPAVPSA